MSLQTVSLKNSLSWVLSRAITGFTSAEQGLDFIAADLSGISTVTWNQLFAAQYTITASGTQSIDLRSFTNLLQESVTLGHALTLFITVSGTGANVNIQPGASNPLQWFFGTTGGMSPLTPGINLTTGQSFVFSGAATSAGQVVDGTHRSLDLVNNGSGTATVKVVILGSTS